MAQTVSEGASLSPAETAAPAAGASTRSAGLATIGDLTNRPQRNLWVDAWRRLRKNKLAVIGLTIVVVFIVVLLLVLRCFAVRRFLDRTQNRMNFIQSHLPKKNHTEIN